MSGRLIEAYRKKSQKELEAKVHRMSKPFYDRMREAGQRFRKRHPELYRGDTEDADGIGQDSR